MTPIPEIPDALPLVLRPSRRGTVAAFGAAALFGVVGLFCAVVDRTDARWSRRGRHRFLGTRLAGGCTSGHGVCGLSRASPRSLVATLVFMAAGFATVFVTRHIIAG